jgi:dTDP-glucose pyrophosphorylase
MNNNLAEKLWRKAILLKSCTIQQAILSLNKSSCQIVLVVHEDGVFQGTLTDGDIRRGLLKGLTLESPISGLVRTNSLIVPPELSRDTVIQLMVSNKIQQIPVVGANRQVVGLHLWDDLTTSPARPNVMVIMAGGMGMRLRPHTENCPKPMLPVAGKPMLEHIIERAKVQGFTRFVLAVHYLGHMIENYFGDGSRFQVRIDYLREQAPLGTAGAISMLRPTPDLPVLVSNGDVMTDIRYGELLDFHCRHAAAATMAVRLHEWHHPFGVVHTSGLDIISFEEKPIARSHINAGIYVLDPAAVKALKSGEQCDMPKLFTRLQEKGVRTIVYPMHEPWLDVGRADDLERARASHS